MNQSEFLPITRNLLKAREKSRVQDAMGFASHCLKDWRGLKAADRSNRNGNGFASSVLTVILKFLYQTRIIHTRRNS